MEVADAFCIIGADATAEQERSRAIVGVEDRPVELLAAAADSLAFRVEEEVVHTVLIVMVGRNVVTTADADGLDELHRADVIQRTTQVADERRRLVTMHLYEVELEVLHMGDDVLGHRVDEDTYSLR